MTCETWHEYRGFRWKVVRVPYGKDYDRRQPYRVVIDGLKLYTRFLWPNQGRTEAARIIDHHLKQTDTK